MKQYIAFRIGNYRYELEVNTSSKKQIRTHMEAIEKARASGEDSLKLSLCMPWFVNKDRKEKVLSLKLPCLNPSKEQWKKIDKELDILWENNK